MNGDIKTFFRVLFGGLAMLLIGKVIAVALAGSNLSNSQYKFSNTDTLSVVSPLEYLLKDVKDVNNITARSYIVFDLESGRRFASHDETRVMPIASVTKLVTAVIAIEEIGTSTRIVIDDKALDTYGDSGKLIKGETMSVKEILNPLLMVSSNDAAEAIAESYGRKEFIGKMNDFAQSVGAYRTYFNDPAGLSSLTMSSAGDIGIIISWINTNHPEVLEITRQKTYLTRGHSWQNPVKFLSWSNYLGGKTGYTPEADMTMAAVFDINAVGKKVAVVILGSENRDEDVMKLLSVI